jgi:hypothetical protein
VKRYEKIQYLYDLVNDNTFIKRGEFSSGVNEHNINHCVADYINRIYEIKAIGGSYEGDESMILHANADSSLHGENIFIEVDYDREVYFKTSYISKMSEALFNYKGSIVEEIMEENLFFQSDHYINQLTFDEDTDENEFLSEISIQEEFENYFIIWFGEDLINQVKESEYWIVKEKPGNYKDDYSYTTYRDSAA